MNRILIILIFCIAIYSCNNASPNKVIDKVFQSTVKKIEIDLSCPSQNSNKGVSKLDSKVEALYNLENNYAQVEEGKFKLHESSLLSGLKRLIENKNRIDDTVEYVLVENFDSSISNLNFSFIKGRKNLGNKLYARARIEEYIFTSESCAVKFIDNINKYVYNENVWFDLNKSPSSIYQEENRVYFVISGGWYMKPFYDEIVNQFKSVQISKN